MVQPPLPRLVPIAFFAAVLLAGCPAEQASPSATPAWVNPLPDDAGTRARGATLFTRHCVPCHGTGADGRGPASVGLDPPPANLTDGERLPQLTDEQIFDRITHGKQATAMPGFQAALSPQDRGAVIRYLRSL